MPTAIGLDLGKYAFRAVEVDSSRKGAILLNVVNLDSSKISNDYSNEDTLKEAGNALKQLIYDNQFTTARAGISLEEKDVFMRIVQFPNVSDKELQSSIKFEAEQYIPLPLDEVNLTSQKINVGGLDPTHINVQLVAARKATLSRYVKLLKYARLIPAVIEPEALAVARSLRSSASEGKASIILHFGFSKTIIIVNFNGSVMFTRTLTLGGDSFTKAVSQELGMDYIQSEEYKKTYGLDSAQADGRIARALAPVMQGIFAEAKRSQAFFISRYPGIVVEKVILSGGPAIMPGLLLHSANSLDLEVELANPFKDLKFGKKLEARKSELLGTAPLYSVSVGLALNNS